MSLNSIGTLLDSSSIRHGLAAVAGEMRRVGNKSKGIAWRFLPWCKDEVVLCGVISLKPNLELVFKKSSKHLF
jgi:hypothetical protein